MQVSQASSLNFFEFRYLLILVIGAVVNVVAICASPWIALWAQERRAREKMVKEHRLWVFRTLVATRHFTSDWRQVEALNLVPLDFEGDPVVLDALRDYIAALAPVAPGEKFDAAPAKRSLYKLIVAAGKAAGYRGFSVETLDALTRNPAAFTEKSTRQFLIETAAIEVLTGQRAIPVEPRAPVAVPNE